MVEKETLLQSNKTSQIYQYVGSRVFLRGFFLHVLECLYRGAPGGLCVLQGAGSRSAGSQECVTRVRDQSAPSSDIKRPTHMDYLALHMKESSVESGSVCWLPKFRSSPEPLMSGQVSLLSKTSRTSTQ